MQSAFSFINILLDKNPLLLHILINLTSDLLMGSVSACGSRTLRLVDVTDVTLKKLSSRPCVEP